MSVKYSLNLRYENRRQLPQSLAAPGIFERRQVLNHSRDKSCGLLRRVNTVHPGARIDDDLHRRASLPLRNRPSVDANEGVLNNGQDVVPARRTSLHEAYVVSGDAGTHWDSVYRTKAPDAVSWYRAHLETSLDLIQRVAPESCASIIDIGGGESTLVDDLLARGYRNVSALDISPTAIQVARKRIGASAANVTWIVGDITQEILPSQHYDVWHDRAVFHFLTAQEERRAYVRQVAGSMKIGGHVIVATFGPEGPTECSGLEVVRYDAESLHAEFGKHFQLLESATELHRTPAGTTQQFLYCLCRVD
jgi:2-polyprenyl-3-methyl-5-hydroxy-6-metoxy-1,4-benzoquinol methylase